MSFGICSFSVRNYPRIAVVIVGVFVVYLFSVSPVVFSVMIIATISIVAQIFAMFCIAPLVSLCKNFLYILSHSFYLFNFYY